MFSVNFCSYIKDEFSFPHFIICENWSICQSSKYRYPHNFQTKPSFVAQLSRHNALEPRLTASAHAKANSSDPAITHDRMTDHGLKLLQTISQSSIFYKFIFPFSQSLFKVYHFDAGASFSTFCESSF